MIPIKQVIEAFKFCLPYYKKAYKEKWDWDKICYNDMFVGLCFFYLRHRNNFLLDLFCNKKSYYKNFLDSDCLLFKEPYRNDYLEPIKFRYNFLKEQIEALTKLQQKGYTHI